MENNCNFKPFDKVLVRYDDQHVWQIDFFSHYVRGVECPYKCLTRDFNQCIPYEGNEHLLETTDKPERCNPDKNTLFGIKLKPGYVLEFGAEKRGVVFPTKIGSPERTKLAIMFLNDSWRMLEKVDLSKVTVIRGLTDSIDLISGDILWRKPEKQTFTKAEIAEKLGMNVQDFEIIEEESE